MSDSPNPHASPDIGDRPAPPTSALAVIFLTVFIDLVGFAMVLPLLPIYADQFAVDEGGWSVGLVMAIYSVMQLIFSPLWGRLSDRIGRRPVIMIGLASSVVFYSLFAVATMWQSLWLLFLSRMGAGVAGATISTAQAFIADVTPQGERTKGMALIGVAFGMGFTLGPLFGALATISTGNTETWPGFAAAGLSLFALCFAALALPESRHAGSESAATRRLDAASFRIALSAPSIGRLLLALFFAVTALMVFETTLGLLIKRSDVFVFSGRAYFFTFAYLGFALMVIQGGVVRRIAGRVSERRLAQVGVLLELTGFALMLLAIGQTSVVWLFVGLTFITAGFSFIQPAVQSLLSRRTDASRQGVVLGVGQSVNASARIVGAVIGIPLLKVSLQWPFVAAMLMMAGVWACVSFSGRPQKS